MWATWRRTREGCKCARERLQVCSDNLTRDKTVERNHETKSRDNLNETAWCAKLRTAYEGQCGKKTCCTIRQTAHASSRVEKMHNRDATGSCRKRTRVKTGIETHKCAGTREHETRHAALGLVGETHGSEAGGPTRGLVARAAAPRRGVSRGAVFPRRPRRRGPAPVFLAPCSGDEPGEEDLHPFSGEDPV